MEVHLIVNGSNIHKHACQPVCLLHMCTHRMVWLVTSVAANPLYGV